MKYTEFVLISFQVDELYIKYFNSSAETSVHTEYTKDPPSKVPSYLEYVSGATGSGQMKKTKRTGVRRSDPKILFCKLVNTLSVPTCLCLCKFNLRDEL